jgi:hypothetical protein
MRIDTNGNIGIGTNNPSYKLDVNGNINFTGTLTQNGTALDLGGSVWGNGATAGEIYYNGGNVGIGTNNPDCDLHILAPDKAQVIQRWSYTQSTNNFRHLDLRAPASGTADPFIFETGNAIEFKVDNNSSLSIGGNGCVGIGSATPHNDYALDVVGRGRFTSTLSTTGVIVSSGRIEAAKDVNTTSYIGRAAIGYAGHSDFASFAHIDHNTSSNYALGQNNSGSTYLNSATNGFITFRENNVEKMTLKSGNLGIGTNNPLNTISLPSNGTIGFIDSISNDTTRGIYFGGNVNDVTDDMYAIHRTSGAWSAPNYQQLRISFQTGIILDPGSAYGKSYVEIAGPLKGKDSTGTYFPISHSDFSSHSQIALRDTGDVYMGSASNGSIRFHHGDPTVNTNEVMRIQDGKVGIGSSNPSKNLDIFGNANTSLKIENSNTFNTVKIYRTTSTSYTFISEVQIWINGTNVATSGTATTDSYGWGGTADKAIDNSHSTGYNAGTQDSIGLQITLAQSYDIASIQAIQVWPRNDYNTYTALNGHELIICDNDIIKYRQEITGNVNGNSWTNGNAVVKFTGPDHSNYSGSFSDTFSTTQIMNDSSGIVRSDYTITSYPSYFCIDQSANDTNFISTGNLIFNSNLISTSNVGIGTNNPSEVLDISGNILIDTGAGPVVVIEPVIPLNTNWNQGSFTNSDETYYYYNLSTSSWSTSNTVNDGQGVLLVHTDPTYGTYTVWSNNSKNRQYSIASLFDDGTANWVYQTISTYSSSSGQLHHPKDDTTGNGVTYVGVTGVQISLTIPTANTLASFSMSGGWFNFCWPKKYSVYGSSTYNGASSSFTLIQSYDNSVVDPAINNNGYSTWTYANGAAIMSGDTISTVTNGHSGVYNTFTIIVTEVHYTSNSGTGTGAKEMVIGQVKFNCAEIDTNPGGSLIFDSQLNIAGPNKIKYIKDDDKRYGVGIFTDEVRHFSQSKSSFYYENGGTASNPTYIKGMELDQGHLGIGTTPTRALTINSPNTANTNTNLSTAAVDIITSSAYSTAARESWRLLSVKNLSNDSNNNWDGLTDGPGELYEQVGINLINYHGAGGTGQHGIASRSKTGIGFTVRDTTTLNENALTIRSNGNVGIGTLQAEHKLHVIGDVKLDLMPSHEEVGTLIIGRQDNNNYRKHSMTFYNSQTEASNYMAFNLHDASSSSSSPVERMRIIGNGNVGIGTDSPGSKLHIHEGGLSITGTSTASQNLNSNMTLGVHMGIYGTTSAGAFIQLVANNSSGSWIDFKDTSNNTDNTDTEGRIRYASADSTGLGGFSFTTEGYTEKMRIALNGNVGIGTGTPSSKLEVVGNFKARNGSVFYSNNATNQNAVTHSILTLRQSPVTATYQHGRPVLCMDWDTGGRWVFGQGGVTGVAGETETLGLAWANNGSFGWSAKFHFTKDGSLGINVKSPTERLHVAGNMKASGHIEAGKDTNTTSYLGRAAIGYNSYHGDMASFSHIDQNSDTSYALLQQGDGLTYINAASSADIKFRIGNVDKMILKNTGNVGIGTASPGAKLDVNGNMKVTGDGSQITIAPGSQAYNYFTGSSTYTVFQGTTHTQLRANNGGIQFFANTSGNNIERMKLTTSGYLGIGTDSPSQMLDVRGNIYSSGYGQFLGGGFNNVQSPPSVFLGSHNNQYGMIQIISNHAAGGWIDFTDNVTGSGADFDGRIRYASNSGMRFYTDASNTDKMHIGTDGNVGINTSSPAKKFTVWGDTQFGNTNGQHTMTNYSSIVSSGSYTSNRPVNNTHMIFYNTGNTAGYMRIFNSNVSNLPYPIIQFKSQSDAAGDCWIGKSSGENLYITNGNDGNDHIYIDSQNGNVNLNSGFFSSSDNRLKHNETSIVNALEDIRKLKALRYFKTTKMYDEEHNFELDESGKPITGVDASGNKIGYTIEQGFIAQDVLQIDTFKDFVYTNENHEKHPTTNEEHPMTLKYDSIFTHSIAALQELDAAHTQTKQELETEKAKTAVLETKVTNLETQLAAVLARLDALENNT